MDISIIVIGDELLIGQVTDTNSGWIARNVNPLGWKIKSVRTVADDNSEIKKAITNALSETDLVLTTGGLGPTKDDITKQALLEIFGGEMIYDKSVEQNVLEVVEKRHLKLNHLTAAQAYVPSSCKVIQNKVGTAPIMWFEQPNGKVLVAMPGVPFETETMMKISVIPKIKEHFHNNDYIEHRTLIVIDYSESDLAIKLDSFENKLPPYIKLAYLPKPGVIRLRLTGTLNNAKILIENIEEKAVQLKSILEKSIISDNDKTVEEILGDILRLNGLTVSTAESCTGGNIAHRITTIAGSSEYYKGSVVAYSNSVKSDLLGVSKESLTNYGAVSEQVVREMATGVSSSLETDCAISTSGIAGPGGGTDDKPVGSVWISAKYQDKIVAKYYQFPGSRDRVIDRASTTAIIMLIKLLIA